MAKRERFPGWHFIKNAWGQLLDRPCVQDILREVQTPAMLRVKLLTTLLNDEFVDREGDLYESRKKLEELQCELKDMKKAFAEMSERLVVQEDIKRRKVSGSFKDDDSFVESQYTDKTSESELSVHHNTDGDDDGNQCGEGNDEVGHVEVDENASTELPEFWHDCGPTSTQKYDADESGSDTGDTTDKCENSFVKGPCALGGNTESMQGTDLDDEVVPGTEFKKNEFAKENGRATLNAKETSFHLLEPDTQFFARRRTFAQLQETQMPETEEHPVPE